MIQTELTEALSVGIRLDCAQSRSVFLEEIHLDYAFELLVEVPFLEVVDDSNVVHFSALDELVIFR